MRWVVLAGLVGACKYEPSANPAGGDAAMPGDDAATVADAPADQPVGPTPSPCVQKWLAGPPTFSIAPIDGGPAEDVTEDRDPWVSKDELIIYWTNVGAQGDHDIFFSSRTTTAQPFNSPTLKSSLSRNNDEDGKVSIAGDDHIGVMVSNRGGTAGGLDLWLATRSGTGTDAFDSVAQTHLGALDTSGDEQDPHITFDGLELYYSGGDPQRLLRSRRLTTTADFDDASLVPGIAEAGSADADPTLTEDGRVLVFTSTRPGSAGGVTDIWYTTRAETFMPFATPTPLPFNTSSRDGDAHITNDGCRIYYSTDDPGDFDIEVATLML